MHDFEFLNRKFKEIFKDMDNISSIEKSDSSIFEKFFPKENPSYGDSWPYIIQPMHQMGENGLGYKYYDGENNKR